LLVIISILFMVTYIHFVGIRRDEFRINGGFALKVSALYYNESVNE